MKSLRFFCTLLAAALLFTLVPASPADAVSSASDWKDIDMLWVGPNLIVGRHPDGTLVLDDRRAFADSPLDVSGWRDITDVVVSWDYILGLRSDGQVLAAGPSALVSEVSSWHDVVQLCGTSYDFAALRADGTVYWMSGDSDNWDDEEAWDESDDEEAWDEPDNMTPETWTGVVRLIPGGYTVFGVDRRGNLLPCYSAPPRTDSVADIAYNADVLMFLYTDGTACLYVPGAWSDSEARRAAVHRWTGLTQIAAGDWIYAGLRRDGTVVSCDLYNEFHETDSWRDVVQIQTLNDSLLLGLRKDGRLYFSGGDYEPELEARIRSWSHIRDIFVCGDYFAALFSDGTVKTAAAGERGGQPFRTSGWKNVKALYGSAYWLVGLCTDGSVLVAENRCLDD